MIRRFLPVAVTMAASVAVLAAQATQTGTAQPGQAGSRSAQQPARDTPSQQNAPAVAGRLSGRVLAADNGRPVKRARVFIDGRGAAGRAGGADRRQRHVRLHGPPRRPLHPDRIEERLHRPLVWPAAAAAGGHSPATGGRPAAARHRLQASARRRARGPRLRRGRRRHARRNGARDAVPVPAGRAPARPRWHGANRRQGRVPGMGPEPRRLLRECRHADRLRHRRRRARRPGPWRTRRAGASRRRQRGGRAARRQRRGARRRAGRRSEIGCPTRRRIFQASHRSTRRGPLPSA